MHALIKRDRWYKLSADSSTLMSSKGAPIKVYTPQKGDTTRKLLIFLKLNACVLL